MKKRILGLLLCAALLVAMLAGCGGPGGETTAPPDTNPGTNAPAATTEAPGTTSAAGEEVTLTFWSPTWHQDADEAVIRDFTALYPNIHIEPTFYSTADIKSNLKIAASSKTMPDMWYMWNGIASGGYYCEQGLTYDLTAYAQAHQWSEKYIPSALELCTMDGKIYGLPQVYTGKIIWYRTDLFAQCGLSVPTTFEEFENVLATLKANGITPISVAGTHVQYYQEALFDEFGGAEDHDALISMEADWTNSETVTKTYEKLVEWAENGYFIDGFLTEDPANEKMYVYSGNAAMVLDNSAVASDVIANGYDPALYDFFILPVGRVASFAKITSFNKNLTDAQFEAAMLFWDYYYSEESIAAHPTIEQPTAIQGAKLSDDLQLANGLLEAIDGAGSYTTTDLEMPAEVYDTLISVEESVLLGQLEPSQVGAEMQAAIDAYKAAQ